MSRIGIKPVVVNDGVTVTVEPTSITAKGPLGELSIALPHGISVTQKDNKMTVARLSDAKQYRALHGTVRNLLHNIITGVSTGFTKKLELVGIGYRAAIEGNDLVLQVGYTHPVRMTIPEGLQAKVEKNVITVTGADKQRLGQFCAEVRQVRKPEPYKGKGIRYQGEHVRMKQGKAMKAAA
jgi:large subunit ribosomal protein L6